MGSPNIPEPLLQEIDGQVLVGLGNWVANSLDVEDLTDEQALLLYMLLNRAVDALWRFIPDLLLPLYKRIILADGDSDE